MKSNDNSQMFVKESGDKLKLPKTRSMVDDKNFKCINLIFHPSDTDS